MEDTTKGLCPEGARQSKSSPDPPEADYLQRRFKSSRSLTTIAPVNQTRDAGSTISLPLPTGTPLHVMTWNEEGLREIAKYDMILKFCKTQKVSLLCAQETNPPHLIPFVKLVGKFYYRATRKKFITA